MTNGHNRPGHGRKFLSSGARQKLLASGLLALLSQSVLGVTDSTVPVMKAATKSTCLALQGQSLGGGNAAIADASIVADGKALAPYCVVRVDFNDSSLKFESRLPLQGWNDKLAFLGGGGFDGQINPVPKFVSQSVLAEGYAITSTNGGYDAQDPSRYFEAEFAFDPIKLVDFTYQSEHRVLPLAKELIERFYAQAPTHSYFEGCSMGGHDALMMAQRYPDDFDGIVARAPAGNIMGLFAKFHQISSAVADPDAALSTAQQSLLAAAVVEQCDRLDGLGDGIVSNPAACDFNPATLRCPNSGAAPDQCLSDKQIATLVKIAAPYANHNGSITHSGYALAGAANKDAWGEYIWPRAPMMGKSLQQLFAGGFIRSFITRDGEFDASRWEPNDWDASLNIIGSMFQAADPDLSRFAARGGKLILWNGVADTSVSAGETTDYYEAVVKTLGPKAAGETVELFLAPGVGHCQGGNGPDYVDFMAAMSSWVEEGRSPSAQALQMHKRNEQGEALKSRPLCKYPSYPHYKGKGALNAAASFDCREN